MTVKSYLIEILKNGDFFRGVIEIDDSGIDYACIEKLNPGPWTEDQEDLIVKTIEERVLETIDDGYPFEGYEFTIDMSEDDPDIGNISFEIRDADANGIDVSEFTNCEHCGLNSQCRECAREYWADLKYNEMKDEGIL